MTVFRTLFVKELREQLRTFRFMGLALVLFFFGLGSMVALFSLPELLELAGPGLEVNLPDVDAADAMVEYVDSAAQVGLLTVVLLTMGSMAMERERRTAMITLSKPVSTGAFLSAKLLAHSLSAVVAVGIVSVIAWVYAVALFSGGVEASAAAGVGLLALYLAFIAVMTVSYSCFFRSQLAVAAVALVSVLSLSVGAAIPAVGKYFPGALVGWSKALVAGSSAEPEWTALVITVAIATATTVIGWRYLRSAEL